MSAMHPILQEAHQIASGARQRQSHAEAEKAKLQGRIRELEAQMKHEKAAADRFHTFALHHDGRLQCPRCWIGMEVAADLAAVPGGDDRQDVFRCARCKSDFFVSL